MELTQRMSSLAEESSDFMRSLGYEVEQKNGQRHSVLKSRPKPEGATEVFVGHIPRDMFEKELYPIMNCAGTVYQMRIMMDFSGTNRGFAFVKYLKASDAELAVQGLNNCAIRDGEATIGVCHSFDNKRLHFGNLPLKITKETLLKELRNILDDVTDVSLPEPAQHSDKRFAIVSFKTHDAATKARRILVPGDITIFDRVVSVDWAKVDKQPPVPNINTSSISAVTSSTSSPTLIQPLSPNNNSSTNNNNNYAYNLSLFNESSFTDINNNNPTSLTDITNFQYPCPPMFNVLGERTKRMLNDIVPPSQQLSIVDPSIIRPNNQLSTNSNMITICNIDLRKVSLSQLKNIFQFGKLFKIVNITRIKHDSIRIFYESKDQAQLALDALTKMPACFSRLALQDQFLRAYKEEVQLF